MTPIRAKQRLDLRTSDKQFLQLSMREVAMEKIKKYIETVIQPKIQGDGGWIEFDSLNGDELTVVFRGECSK